MRASLCLLLVLTLAALAPAADDPSPEPTPKLAVTMRNKGDTFEVKPTTGGLTLRMNSKSNSGQANIEVKSGDLPARFTVVLPELRYLALFTCSDGSGGVDVRVNTTGQSVWRRDASGKYTTDPKEAVLTVTLEQKTKPNRIEVSFRYAKGAKPGKRLSLNWMQYFQKKG
jgi:hypothetical protein